MKPSGGRVALSVLREGHIETTAEYKTAPSIVSLDTADERCLLDQRYITYNSGKPMTTTRPLRVFLCHSSNDKPAVRELYQKLRAEPWIQPWLAFGAKKNFLHVVC